MTTASPVADALTRTERLLLEQPVLESFIARREAGETRHDDQETADALAAELAAHQSPDGSWGGSLQHTAEALLLLSELSPSARMSDEIARGLAWLRARRREEGVFGEPCTPDQHAAGICRHFAGGFFSPGPSNVSFAGTTLSNGLRLASDSDARLGLSALALRAVLAHSSASTDDLLQVDALRRIADLLFRDPNGISVPAALTVITTLALAPRNATHLSIVHGALSRLVRLQRGDGSWPGAEMFHVAETLLIAVQAGYGSPAFDAGLTRIAEKLALSQQKDGSWSSDAGPYRLLTGWRTLRHVAALETRS
jgi:hypothetical protein